MARSINTFHRGGLSSNSSATPSSPLQRIASLKPSSAPRDFESQPRDSNDAPLELEVEFHRDPVFSKFLSDDFNSTKFASEALSSGSAAACADKLEEGIRLLEKHLRHQVYLRHDELLQQLSSLKDAEGVLTAVKSGVVALQGSVQRVRSEIAEPYKQIRLKSRQLSNLHDAVELLQTIVRVLRQLKKFRELMEGKPDLAKAAQLYNEIETLRNEGDLNGVEVVDEEIPWLMEAGNRLRSEAMKVFESGMEALNQSEVGSALQVYYNMGELKATVEAVVGKYKAQAVKSVSSALDMKAVSASVAFGVPGGVQRSGTPQLGSSVKAREGLWQRLGACMDQLHSIVVAVWHLQRVLSKKRDPFTHVLFLDEVMQEGDSMLTDRVWDALVKSFASQMKSAFTASSFIKETFVLGYPKLLSMVENVIERILQDTNVKGFLPALKTEGKNQMLAAIESFQTAYLAHCLSSLSDLVNNSLFPMSSRGGIPSQEQISRFISRIQEEIESVKLDAHLTLLVLREIGKVLQLLAEKAEYQISTGPESRQVMGPASPLQVKNFTICLHLQEVHTRISAMVSSLPTVAMEVLSPSLGAIYGVACDAVTPLFQAMLDRLENCILQIHDQSFGGDDINAGMDENGSRYMEEIQKSIIHFRREFLSKLLPSATSHFNSVVGESICARLTRKMAARVLTFFVRHAAIIRPLSESGKLQLTRDMAELELVVGQNLFQVEQLGAPYRALRALKPLFFQETSRIASSPLLQDLPCSVVLHHLYSRAPDELESPMQRTKLTPKQYSLWLDSQGEEQIWKGIKATLDDYAAKISARGDKEFSPVYPLMLQLGSPLAQNTPVSKGN
uniref:Conserved oligomeric Golgi complex subunit 5 n=1 Tax=Araucaria cunninghamii TaxID=56994 RepID=A0A0D6QR93_ARACU